MISQLQREPNGYTPEVFQQQKIVCLGNIGAGDYSEKI
jgi:hypothetical protein